MPCPRNSLLMDNWLFSAEQPNEIEVRFSQTFKVEEMFCNIMYMYEAIIRALAEPLNQKKKLKKDLS